LETESVAVARHEVKERATILVFGEYRFRIVAPVHQVKASVLRPLQIPARTARKQKALHEPSGTHSIEAVHQHAIRCGVRRHPV
jgi:hypothetical protein